MHPYGRSPRFGESPCDSLFLRLLSNHPRKIEHHHRAPRPVTRVCEALDRIVEVRAPDLSECRRGHACLDEFCVLPARDGGDRFEGHAQRLECRSGKASERRTIEVGESESESELDELVQPHVNIRDDRPSPHWLFGRCGRIGGMRPQVEEVPAENQVGTLAERFWCGVRSTAVPCRKPGTRGGAAHCLIKPILLDLVRAYLRPLVCLNWREHRLQEFLKILCSSVLTRLAQAAAGD